MTDLLHLTESHRDEIIADILALVDHESGSYDAADVRACGEYVLELASERLGEPTSVDATDNAEGGKVYAVTYAGDAGGKVAILAHYDTVWRTGSIKELPSGREERDGREVLIGPGVLDMKSGLVQGIWALATLREAGEPTPTVTFVFNPDEEIGSTTSRPVIERVAKESDAVLSLEPTAAGQIKTGRKGIGIGHITVKGLAAHAGLEPEKGASAIHALADVIPRITALARPEAGTTINVGQISGGTATNVVAAEATAEVDIRVLDPDEPKRIDAGFAALAHDDDRISIETGIDWNRPPMQLGDATRPLLAVAEESGAALGREVGHVTVGGASDANFVAPLGIPVLCGLGGVGGGPHARSEHVIVDEIAYQTALVAGILTRLTEDGWRDKQPRA